MSDPYKVLGISRDATDDEVKKAYREKSRKYHPDTNIDNPNKDKAEEMFKLVQQAYDQIMNERQYKGGFSGSTYGSGSAYSGGYYGNANDYRNFEDIFREAFGGYYNGAGNHQENTYDKDSSYYTAASNYINSGHFSEALNVLNNIEDRSAQWYFLSAIANNGLGNNILALDFAKKAVQMDPNNLTYQRFLQTIENGGRWYGERQYSFGGDETSLCRSTLPCYALCLLSYCCSPRIC